jgi:alpha-tubulin suppressor-like RCC1 family protein/uncharacterized protein (DUF2141 family)
MTTPYLLLRLLTGRRAAPATRPVQTFGQLAVLLLLALLPLLAGAGTPVLRMNCTVGPGPGVNTTAFIDQVEVINAATGQVVAAAVPNGGFETSDALSNGSYGFNPTGASWSFAGSSGIAATGSALSPPPAPEGTRVAFLQTLSNRAGSIGQTLPNLPAGAYQVRARVAQRPGNTTPLGVSFAVDGAELSSIVPSSSTSYDTYLSPAFYVDAVLRLEALGSAGNAADVTAFVDQVELLNVRDGSNVAVTNSSFETTGSLGAGTGIFAYAPTGTGWDFNSRSGIAANGSIFNNPDAPDGIRVSILQSAGGINGAFEQRLAAALPVTGLRVRLWAVQRTATVPDQRVRVLLNGQEVGRIQPANSFTQYTLPSASTTFTLSINLPPTLTAVSPLIGQPGTVLTLTGTNLAGTTSINFTGAAGVKTVTSGFTVNAAGTQITGVVVPAGAQTGPVTATNGAGTSAVGTALFSRATTLGAGGLHSAQVRPDGTLWTWGYNDQGQQGNGSIANTVYLVPQRVGSASNWVSVSAGQYFTLALRTDGTLWSWGKNSSGQLGRPSTATDQGLPTQVGSAATWVSISAGADHALAVRADGTLWAWGDNTYGQLGLGDLVNRAAPVQVGSLTTWASASAGGFHSVAVRADGTAWAWGRNHYGQLGQNGQTQQTSPTQVYGGLTSWVSVSVGYLHTMALQANGTLWTWGANYVGQLGQGATNNVGYPVQVGTLTSWLSADAGDVHSLALRADGTLYAWGDNTAGQLGLGDNTQRNAPTQVGSLTNWADAAGGNTHTLALQSCDALWAWGGDNGGQLGNGDNTFTNRNTPVLIVSPVSLLSFSPSSAPGGATVVVTGTGLTVLSALTVNGTNALASVTNNTSSGFTFVVPAGATLGAGTVTVAAGCGAASSTGFTVIPPPTPTITSFTPGSGPLGTPVMLTGTNLTGLTSVQFGGVPAVFSVQSATQATVIVPAQAVNQRIRVTSPTGTALSAAAFQVTRPSTSAVFPQLASVISTAPANSSDFDLSPAVTDLDSNGRLDLIVGCQSNEVLAFEQTAVGSSTFAARSLSFSGYSFTSQYALHPTVTDLDGDGLLDLLVGNSDGNIQYLEQTALNSSDFALRNNLTVGASPLNAGNYAAPTVTDLDGDGLLDLLVANSNGNVRRYEQTAANATSFTDLNNLTTDGITSLYAGNRAVPTVTDLDGDGLLDLLVGNYDGNVTRYEQTTAGGSVFAPASLTTDGSNILLAIDTAAPVVTDLDGDGLLDLLAGVNYGAVFRFEQAPVPTLTSLSTSAELPGQSVTLTGTGFVSGSTVRFGGVAAASVTYASPTQLTAVVPVGAAAGSSALTVGSYDVASAAPASPAFEVLQVYRSATASGCLSTAPLTINGTGGAGKWRYLRLPGAGGAVVAAIEDTRNLGSVTAQALALGTGTSAAVRDDGRGRRYLDRNFALTATNKNFPGQSVRVRFFGLSSELGRLTAADINATAANLKLSQYSGPNEDCDLANNGTPTDNRLLPAPATTLSGADWFTAEATVADHFSEFYLTGASTPLPVELVAFTATLAGPAAVRMAWATASEKNSAAFEVERSTDGELFARIGTVAAAGSSSTARAYELLDAKLPTGAATLYYRLKQVDADGTFSYSPVRTVTGAAEGLALYPNPTRGGSATLVGARPGTPVTVYDALGRPVATATADASGTAALVLPAGTPAGVYLVRAGSKAVRLTVE